MAITKTFPLAENRGVNAPIKNKREREKEREKKSKREKKKKIQTKTNQMLAVVVYL